MGRTRPLEHDFSEEEILDMPIVGEVTASDLDIETDKVGLEDDDILSWKTDSDLQSEGGKKNLIYLSREEAEVMFA